MNFKNNTLDQKITMAATRAESLLSESSPMIQEIARKNDFKYNSGTGASVAWTLSRADGTINIYTYKSKLPWSKAVGYFEGRSIFINTRKLPFLTQEDLVGLLLHEFSHYCNFQHGNNYKTKEKVLHSVPYFISENIGRWL